MNISIGTKTDVGCVREVNEDSSYTEISHKPDGVSLLLVADGMGGQVKGKEASTIAVATIKALFSERVKTEEDIDDIEGFITSSFQEANRAVFEKGRSNDAEMGTTLTAAFIKGERANIGHVGDSRAYHIRGREIKQLTEDHTLAEEMIHKGKTSWKEIEDSPMRSMLTRSIGTGEEIVVDQPIAVYLQEGDVLLLCTDGLTNLVKGNEILSIIHNTPDTQAACDRLVAIARERGGHDNITIVGAECGALKRIQGLGVGVKNASMRRLKRRRGLIAFICIILGVLVLLLGYLIYLHSKGYGFYKIPVMHKKQLQR